MTNITTNIDTVGFDGTDSVIINPIINKSVEIEELTEFKKETAYNLKSHSKELEDFKKITVNNFLIVDNQINNIEDSLLKRIDTLNQSFIIEATHLRSRLTFTIACLIVLTSGIIYLLLK